MRKTLLAAVACGALLVATPATSQSLFGSLFGGSKSPVASFFSSSKPAPLFNFAPRPSSGPSLSFGGGGLIRNGANFALTTWSKFTNHVGLPNFFGFRW